MVLEERFTQPQDWQWDNFKNAHDYRLRYGFCTVAKPRGLVVFAPGRTETSEEYFEIARDYLKRNFAVAVLDWQGQGLSYRYGDDNTRHHSEGFHADVDDFSQWLSVLNAKHGFQNLPKILVAHSMGGNITLRYMADHPDTFQCAVMVAPMLGIKMSAVLNIISSPALHLAQKMGWMNERAPGQLPWSETFYDTMKPFASSDTIRRDVQKFWYLENPALRCGGVTYGWFGEAMNSIRILHQKDTAQKITTPTLFAIAGSEKVVSNKGIYTTVNHMPNVETIEFKGAQHKIIMECDLIRDRLLHAMDGFIDKYLQQSPTP